MKRAHFILAWIAMAVPVIASGSPLDVVNEIRARGCETSAGGSAPLKASVQLNAVAEVNADGIPLAESLKRVGYQSARSTSIHVKGTGQFEDALARLLRLRLCADVSDAGYREFGTARRGKDMWLVLARPFAAPPPEAASSVSQRILQLVNEARATPRTCGSATFSAAGPLKLDSVLEQAALTHARDMSTREVMSHSGSDGSKVAERATRAGYKWRAVAENLAAGQETPEEAVQSWLTSPGHCANLMGPQYTEMGVAYAENPKSDAHLYWAQVFATPR